MKNNYYYISMMDALDLLEGIRGPDHDEYILVMTEISNEIQRRIETCKRLKAEEDTA